MKSVQMNSYGHADSLFVSDQDIPQCGPYDLLVAVRSVAINPFDLKLLAGMYKYDIVQELPVVIGGDFSGDVVARGQEVNSVPDKTSVYGSGIAFAGGSGALAEYVRVNMQKVAFKPQSLDYEHSAALVTPGCTAYQAIYENLQLKPGQKLLIHGAGGAVGELALQMALELGAQVAVTVSNDDIGYMKELGADLIVNYNSQPFENIVKDYDAVLDSQGGDILLRSYQVLKAGGRLVSLVSIPDPKLLDKYGVWGKFQMTEIATRDLDNLRALVDKKNFSQKNITLYPFDKAVEAIDAKMKGLAQGKIVIKM